MIQRNIKIKNDYLDGEILSTSNYIQIQYEISKEIKKYRKKLELTQSDLASILDVKQAMISKLEAGEYNPTVKFLTQLWSLLDTSEYNVGSEMLNKINNILVESYELKYNKKRFVEFSEFDITKLNCENDNVIKVKFEDKNQDRYVKNYTFDDNEYGMMVSSL